MFFAETYAKELCISNQYSLVTLKMNKPQWLPIPSATFLQIYLYDPPLLSHYQFHPYHSQFSFTLSGRPYSAK